MMERQFTTSSLRSQRISSALPDGKGFRLLATESLDRTRSGRLCLLQAALTAGRWQEPGTTIPTPSPGSAYRKSPNSPFCGKMGQLLEVRDVTKSFGSLRALDGVSLDVEERKVVILIGPNGSGKTTLINVISGLYKPDSGRILFQKRDATGLAPFKLYDMGLARTFQIPALFWKLTVLEN